MRYTNINLMRSIWALSYLLTADQVDYQQTETFCQNVTFDILGSFLWIKKLS